MSSSLLPLILIAPLVGSALALFAKLSPRPAAAVRLLAPLSLLASLVVLILLREAVFAGESLRYLLGGWEEPYGIALVLDGPGWISLALIAVVSLIISLFILADAKYGAGFVFFYLLLTAGMFGVSLTGDLFTMFVCFEIVAIAAYVLIAWEKSPTGLVASFKYLILSSTGILFFLFGIFLIYRDLGTLSISIISTTISASRGLSQAPAIHLALASLCVGIGVRTAFIPFHTWLPEAHAYAPHPVSALLSGVLIKVSFFAMVRLLILFDGEYLYSLLLWIGAVTALTAVISALAQSDAKRLLAYHSISQMGYILAVFAAASSVALTAAFAHAVSHALFKSLLFLTVGVAVEKNGERNLYRMRPLGREIPVFAAAYFVGALSIAGLPPFTGYASKALISAGMKGSPAYLLLTLTGVGTVASFIKLSRIYLPGPRIAEGAPVVPKSVRSAQRPSPLAAAAVGLLALACLAAGIFGSRAAGLLHRLLYGEAYPYGIELFTPARIFGLLPTLGAGALLYLAVVTEAGKRAAARLKGLAPDLRTVMGFFFAGLLLFAAAAY